MSLMPTLLSLYVESPPPSLSWPGSLYLASDLLLDEEVLSLVVEDDMDLLRPGSTDVRAKHDVVR